MSHKLYNSEEEYRKKQARLTRMSWLKGSHAHQVRALEKRKCNRSECKNYFEVKPYNPKVFCSQNCSAIFNNQSRPPFSKEWRRKISESLKLNPTHNVNKGKILVPRLVRSCIYCNKTFQTERWQNHKYCSASCAIKDVGSRTTSPKASKGINGVRLDIHPTANFYSRWEANFARILNHLKIKWKFQPKQFNLKSHKYTPDFYLPDIDVFIEIKNFLSEYSKKRDDEFRELYPRKKLLLILKADYYKLQEEFAPIIENWEFSK